MKNAAKKAVTKPPAQKCQANMATVLPKVKHQTVQAWLDTISVGI